MIKKNRMKRINHGQLLASTISGVEREATLLSATRNVVLESRRSVSYKTGLPLASGLIPLKKRLNALTSRLMILIEFKSFLHAKSNELFDSDNQFLLDMRSLGSDVDQPPAHCYLYQQYCIVNN